MSEKPLISVVICTYKISMVPDLLKAVESVLTQTYKDIEVIVVADQVPELISILNENLPTQVSLYINKSPGLSAARNVGIKHANGEIVAFLDDDAVAHPNWIAKLVPLYKDPSVIGVGGRIIPRFEENTNSWFPEELNWIVGGTYRGHPEQVQAVRNLMGCNMSFRREKLKEVGYFNEAFGKVQGGKFFHDDTEISLRLRRTFKGAKLIYVPDAIVYHKVKSYRTTLSYIISRSYLEGKSKSYLVNQKTCKKSSGKLSVEEDYLSYLLKEGIPRNIMATLKSPSRLPSLVAILASIVSVGLGYISS